MARAGEGDPRWIVEERSDAANVNNWHWIERDVLRWSTEKIEELLVNKLMQDSKYKCKIESVKTDGVSTVSIRKGQLKQIFDLELEITFAAQLNTSKTKNDYEGKIFVPEFSWDTDETNAQFTVSFTSTKKDDNLLGFIKNSFKTLLLDTHAKYKEALSKECTQGLVLPTKHNPSSSPDTKSGVTVLSHPIPPYSGVDQSRNKERTCENPSDTTNVDPSTFAVNITKTFNCPSIEIYNMFLTPEKIMRVTNSPAYVEPKVGGKFSYIDGTVSGNFTKLDNGKYIEMNWRLKSWPEIYYSVAKLTFSDQKNNTCQLVIKHDKILAHDLERVDHGWKRMFLAPMQAIFA